MSNDRPAKEFEEPETFHTGAGEEDAGHADGLASRPQTHAEKLAVHLREAIPAEEQGALTFGAWLALAARVEGLIERAVQKQKDASIKRVLAMPIGEWDLQTVVRAIMGRRRRQ